MNLFARLTGLSVVTAIIAILILFLEASSTASQSLEKAATNQLTSTLADRKVQLQYYLSSLQEELSLYANLPMYR